MHLRAVVSFVEAELEVGWSAADTGALAGDATDMGLSPRLRTELAYGFGGRRKGARWQPYVSAETGALGVGVRLTSADDLHGALELGRREGHDLSAGPVVEHTLGMQLQMHR